MTLSTATPVVTICDNRGMTVRTLNWNRESDQDPLRLFAISFSTGDIQPDRPIPRSPPLYCLAAGQYGSTEPAQQAVTGRPDTEARQHRQRLARYAL
ncbi:Uncharacterised protein [Salmonella enterica subsp. arizonae]|uniref:Uncharacterized protein n=1 Tax=Salmonella enterica subsp. arizonae TaxID=59203 RepID=A0A379T9I6_SALER|nr:Uncharacterised protein [Salmonella enterica subsp. arizonae]